MNNSIKRKSTFPRLAWWLAVGLAASFNTTRASDAVALSGIVATNSEGPRFELEWSGQPGARYRVQARDAIEDAAGWRAEDLVRAEAGAPIRWMAPESLRNRRFYRLAGPDPEISSVEPAIAPPKAPVTLYIRGQCFQTNDTFRVGGAVIPGGAILSSALGRMEVPPQSPGVVRVELVRDSAVLSFFDVFFGDPITAPESVLQEPPVLPPGAPVAGVNTRQRKWLPANFRFSTGEFQTDETDLIIPGRGLDFVWARTYRSRTGGDSPMGYGWTHSYDIFIESAGDGVAVRDGTGRRDVFRRQDDGTFTLPGCFREGRWDDVTGNFILTFADSGFWEFYHFNVRPAGGKLARSVDRIGNTMRFEYDGAGRLVRVIDTLDRTNTVAYNAEGRIASVTDFSGRTVAYEYVTSSADTNGAPGDLVAVISPAVTGTPNGNDFPGGKTNRYTYARGFAEDRLNHNLLTAADGLGQAQFALVYATTEIPSDFEFDTVQSVLRGVDKIDIRRLALTPDPSNDFATVRCVINDFVGNVTEEYYDARHRLLRRLEFTGRANPAEPTTDTRNRPVSPLRPDDPPFFETRWEWNNDSLCVALQRPLTNRIEWVYQGDLEPGVPPRLRANVRVARHVAPGDFDGDGRTDIIVSTFEHDPRFGSEPDRASAGAIVPTMPRHAVNTKGTGAKGGRVVEAKEACGETSAGVEDCASFVTRIVNPRGNVTTAEYDASGNCNVVNPRAARDNHLQGAVDVLAAMRFAYNAYGQLTAITNAADAEGRRRVDTFAYHTSGPQRGYLASAVVDAGSIGRNLTTSYEYDARGNVTRVTDPRGTATDFEVNALNQTVAKQSQGVDFGQRVRSEFHFDAADQLVLVKRGNVDASGSFDPNGGAIAVAYDPFHRPVRTVNVSPDALLTLTNEFSYDGNGQLTLHRSPPAVHGLDPFAVTQTIYDERGLLFREIHAAGSPQVLTLQSDYDGNRKRTRVSKIDAIVWKAKLYSYDGLDRLIRVTDPMGNETHYEYDLNDNLKRAVHYGETNDVPGNAGNRRLAETRYEYDSLDRCVRFRPAFFDIFTELSIGDGFQDNTLTYAPNGLVTRATNDRGFSTDYEYDSAGRLLRVTDARTNRVEYAYDANGNVLSETETGRSDLGGPDEVFVRSYSYDALNRRVADWDNVGNTNRYAYDSHDNLIRHTDPRGNDVCYDYDGLNRKGGDISYVGPCDAGNAVRTNRLVYQTTRLTSSTDGNGNTTTYTYDSLDRRVRITFADNTSVTNVYDGHGNLVWTRDANGTEIISSYDALDRCIQKSIKPGPGVTNTTTQEAFAYDGLSRLVRAQNNASEVTFAYDSLGQVVRESSAAPALGFPCQKADWLHDAHGLMLAQTNPSGRVVEFLYDELDRVTRLRTRAFAGAPAQLLGTFAYAGPDRLVRVTRPNGIQTDYTYGGRAGVPNPPDDFGWGEIRRVRHAVGGTTPVIDERVFAHDRSQNKTLRTLAAPFIPGGAVVTAAFQYDALDRLVQSVTVRDGLPVQDATYVLDPNGNRQVVIGGGTAQPYLMDNTLPQPADFQVNQYSVTPFDARQYDENGNLRAALSGDPVDPQVRSFLYDYADRLVAVQDATGPVATYAYDALGRRIAKVLYVGTPPVPVQTNRYLYAGDQVIEEEDGGGATVAAHVWPHMHQGGSHARISAAGEVLFHHCDDQGSLLALTDAAGNVVERCDYDDYGLPRFLDAEGNPLVSADGQPLNASAVGNHYLFHGHRWDDETGLYFMNKVDMVDDAELLDLVEMEIRDLPPRTSGQFDPNTGSTLSRTYALPHVFDQKGRAYAGNNPWSAKEPVVKATSGLKDTLKTQVRMAGGGGGGASSVAYAATGRSAVPNPISKCFTVSKQTQGASFGERVNAGLQHAGNTVASGVGRFRPAFFDIFVEATSAPKLLKDKGTKPGSGPVISTSGTDTDLLPWGAGIFRYQGSDSDLLPWGAGIFRSGGDPTVHALGASAFATGSSVAFGAGRDSHTAAHELVHVAQQSSGVSSVLKTKHDTVKNSINNVR